MTQRPPEVDSLIKIGSLHEVERNQENIERFLGRAEQLLKDAENSSISDETVFLSAYEGILAVCNAGLLHFEARVANIPGHRSTALQAGHQVLGLSSKSPTIIKLHNKRNSATYEDPGQPLPPASVKLTVEVLRDALKACRQLTTQPSEL